MDILRSRRSNDASRISSTDGAIGLAETTDRFQATAEGYRIIAASDAGALASSFGGEKGLRAGAAKGKMYSHGFEGGG